MELNSDAAEVFVPDRLGAAEALARTTHMGIGAHPDDLEILAWEGILSCYLADDQWFCGVVVCDGAGAPRRGRYADLSDPEMAAVRREEQKRAAKVGRYGAQVLLGYSSHVLRRGSDPAPVQDLREVLRHARPRVVYTHNLADKHDTHVATALRVIEAIRGLPPAARPERSYGCEVWRDLDWLMNDEKITFDASTHEDLQRALLGVFESQVSGGKRYDLATMARRRAHATYHAPRSPDAATGMIFAMELTPLIRDPDREPRSFVGGAIARFADDVADRIDRMT